MTTDDRDVVVVGGGPTGLMLASECGCTAWRCWCWTRETEPTPYVRALGLHVRSVENRHQHDLGGWYDVSRRG